MNKEIKLSKHDIKRFWAKVKARDKDECWQYAANDNSNFCPRFSTSYYSFRAQRVAWVLANGTQIPEGMDVFHAPHLRPNGACCNESHLILAPSIPIGKLHSTPKLNESQVSEIRKLYQTEDYTLEGLGEIYGVSRENIRAIVHFKSWKEVV